MSIKDRVKETIAEAIGIPIDELKDEARFVDDLHLDSLDFVEIILGLEEAFQFEIPDKDVDKMVTITDMVKYVEKKEK